MQSTVVYGFSLSPQQRRLWLLQNGAFPFLARGVVAIEGNLDPRKLRESLHEVVARHDILRTAFQTVPGLRIPVQVPGDCAPSWEALDMTHIEEQHQEQALARLMKESELVPFDFAQGALVRATLVVLSDRRYALLIVLPTLCADVLTLKNIVKEISRSYAARSESVDLEDEPPSYIQFSEWQNDLLNDEAEETGREYWRRRDFAPLLKARLPFEGEAAGVHGETDLVAVSIGEAVAKELQLIAHRYETDVETVLAACWQTLLWKLLWQPNVGVGQMFHCRKYEELHGAIGLFAKWLPVECRFEEHTPFRDVLNQVEKASREAVEWQEHFTWQPSGARPAGSDLDEAYFAFGFEYVKTNEKYNAGELSFSLRSLSACAERFKIKLSCTDRVNSISAEMHFDPSLYETNEIERLAAQFKCLVESVAATPEACAGELRVISDEDLWQLLIGFNDTKSHYSTDKCLHRLFEEQAVRTPNEVAVVYEDKHLTYAELNRRANRLAQYLRALGVGLESRAALLMERSPDLIVGLLGILKAGGAYVPLDVLYPKDRLSLMLKDANAVVLLTQEHLAGGLPQDSPRTVCLDADWEMIGGEREDNPDMPVHPGNLAYVIYTSGSAGQPKGVAVEHRQLLNYLSSIKTRLDLPEGASFATVSTFAADLTNTMVFPSLVSGGCLHIISHERSSNAEALADYFQRNHIDCLKIVPSHLEAIHSSGNYRLLPRRRLIVGGEAARRDWIEGLQGLAPDCVIFNHYGPTETTVGVLTYRVEEGWNLRRCDTLPLGRPIANTRIYLTESSLRPVPFWVTGEVHVGGDNVSRGYLNRPDRTAERFIPDPFSPEPGSRLYMTGDLARYLPDGAVEFLGRIDGQVKLRGFRIELGEIRGALLQHSSIRDVVVIVRADESGNKRLVAYVVAAQKPAPVISDLRKLLRRKLPEYAIPSAFVMLGSLPLTPNGKVDLRSLPSPEDAQTEQSREYVAPRTALEEVLAGIWKDVLGVRQVGVLDNFFEIGGHSLLAMRVISRMSENFHLDLPLRMIFDEACVEQLAKAMIANHPQPAQIEKIARIILKIKGMSAEAVHETLAKKTGRGL